MTFFATTLFALTSFASGDLVNRYEFDGDFTVIGTRDRFTKSRRHDRWRPLCFGLGQGLKPEQALTSLDDYQIEMKTKDYRLWLDRLEKVDRFPGSRP